MELTGNLWENLGEPKFVLAPMVEQSELPWRMLSRKHGAQLCFAPMLHSQNFIKDRRYRQNSFTTCPEDRPLVVQFCGNVPNTLLEASKLVEDSCDVIDLNLGCPQGIAKRGFYGSYLQDDWKLIFEIVKTLRENLKVPVSCKIRIFEDVTKTIAYAKMLEEAGCQMLSVHGRTREQKGLLTGLADWSQIKAVKENVTIPVLANGNILVYQDIQQCLKETLCEGVMSAEGHLYNPYIFDNKIPPVWEPALEYLDLCEKFPCPLSNSRGHMFKMCYHLFCIPGNEHIRDLVAKGRNRNDFRNAIMQLKEKYLPYHLGQLQWNSSQNDYNLNLPPWLCQPYIRPLPQCNLKGTDIVNKPKSNEKENLKRNFDDKELLQFSRKKLKRANKLQNKEIRCRRIAKDLCSKCSNPKGLKCEYELCKKCCRSKCNLETVDCIGHGLYVKLMASSRQKKEEKELSCEQICSEVT